MPHKKRIHPKLTWLFSFSILFLNSNPTFSGTPTQTLGAVATQQALATQTAVRILQKGGNAFDAAVGAALTLGVVEPYNSGLGGGGFALLWDAKKRKIHAIDFRETAPRGFGAQALLSRELPADAFQSGPWAIATPGTSAGLGLIHQRWGKMSWADLFADAIDYAERGFDGGFLLHRRVQERSDCLSRDYQSSQIYKGLLQEEPTSTILLQPEIAKSLKRLRDFGVQDFYVGELARSLVAGVKSKGGLLSEEDLAQYHVIERTALSVDFPWGRVWGFPPPSSGGSGVLSGLTMLEMLQKQSPEALTDRWPLTVAEVLEKIFTERHRMGDPDFLKTSIPQKTNRIPPQGAAQKAVRMVEPVLKGNTTHLSIIDREGNAIAMTLTLNLSFGSCLTAGGTGIMMNSEMDDFTTQPERPNAFGLVQGKFNFIEPEKRPLSSMAPTLVTHNGKVIAALGSPGGPRIISSVLQVMAQKFLLGKSWQDAIRWPRIHFQGIPSRVEVELGSPESWDIALQGKGFSVFRASPWGNVQIIAWDAHAKTWIALSDPRRQGTAQVILIDSAPSSRKTPTIINP